MDTKYGKLISRDKNGNLTAVYPEIACDREIDFQYKRAVNPVSNYVIAEALEGLKGDIQNAFTSENGGLGWDEDTQKGYVDFSKMPTSQIEGIVNSMVDPNGAIVADSSSGKLTVDFSKLTPEQIMALCSTNGGIIASNEPGANHGKLAIDFSKMPADQIKAVVRAMVDPNGAIIGDPTSGLLTVDFSKLTVEQVMALCLAGGGIVADQNTGKLKIDFSAIDADTKRNITSSLKMQVPLSASKTVYVDNVAGNDTYLDASGVIIAGKGESKATAFKTIQQAVTFVTEQWAMGTKSVTIRLVANESVPYAEYVNLPPFTRTTGNIHIVSDDASNRAKVVNKSASGRLFYCTGGSYSLQNLDLEAEYYYTEEDTPHYPGLVGAESYGSVTIYGCHSKCSYRAGDQASPRWFSLRLFTTSGFGSISFGLISGSHNTIEYHKNNAHDCVVIQGQSNGKFSFHSGSTNEIITIDIPIADIEAFEELVGSSTYSSVIVSDSSTAGNKLVKAKITVLKSLMNALGLGTAWRNYVYGDSMYKFEVWGECTQFCGVSTSTLVRYAGGANYDQFFVVPEGKTATGKRFQCGSSSCIDMSGMANSFPGTTVGTCNASAFCYSNTNVDGIICSTVADEGFSYLAKNETATGSKTFGAGLFGNTVAMSANEINLALGTVFTKTITAATSFTIKGTPASTAATFNLILTNGGSKTITWPNTVKWTDGTPPSLTASGVDVLTFLTPDGGATWYGCLALNGAA